VAVGAALNAQNAMPPSSSSSIRSEREREHQRDGNLNFCNCKAKWSIRTPKKAKKQIEGFLLFVLLCAVCVS